MNVPPGTLNEEHWRQNHQSIRARALDLLEGRLSVIETARAIVPLARWAKVDNEPEFRLFLAIDSETDDLPVGDVRAYWASCALAREDARIEAAESGWREQARRAAAKIVERYG